jgi:hypothetical protein
MKLTTTSSPLKKILIWLTIICAGIITIYLGYISLISLWIGVENSRQQGFWVPIVAGTILFVFIFWIFSRTTHILLTYLKKEDSLKI